MRLVPGIDTTIIRIGVDTITIGPPSGSGGGGASVFSWANASSAVWSIAHNLGHHPPAVTVIDLAGNVLTLFDRSDPDVNHTTLTFAAPVAGIAYLI